MISILSLVTSIKDYLEVVHKFIEYDSVNINYTELGSILTFFLISIKNCIFDFFSFSWLVKQNFWSLPIVIPEISSAMISEISVLDGYFHNAFNFLDTPVSYGMPVQNGFVSCLEKLTIGLINSFFLFLPTSTAHIITLRRFVMQGLDAGYMAGLGTIAGNIVWLASVILGCRFFVIPWLSLDIFRYILGFILLVKYMWDSYNERKTTKTNENISFSPSPTSLWSFGTNAKGGTQGSSFVEIGKRKMFLLNFLLALTEQTSIYPFISNMSINPEISILETFQLGAANADSSSLGSLTGTSGTLFIFIHLAYLLGITLGSVSLLHLSCWFWENPAFKTYMWVISSFKVSTSFYYKVLNFGFLYLTMLSAICSIPYYGLDYTITNPLGYVNDDRIIQDKVVLETSFLGTKASDRNTRRNRGRHGRRERWKRRIRKYRTFDASLYDQGIYDLFTIEDLNYGFDRFWLRRKLRNHRVRFRFFPGPWMRSFKKQLAKPRLESYTGPRIEFFRILFEQVYHPSFHSFRSVRSSSSAPQLIPYSKQGEQQTSAFSREGKQSVTTSLSDPQRGKKGNAELYLNNTPSFGLSSLSLIPSQKEERAERTSKERESDEKPKVQVKNQTPSLIQTKKSTLRKFIRKFDNRVKTLKTSLSNYESSVALTSFTPKRFAFSSPSNGIGIYRSPLFLSLSKKQSGVDKKDRAGWDSKLNNFYLTALISKKEKKSISILDSLDEQEKKLIISSSLSPTVSNDEKGRKNKKDLQILHYRSLLTKSSMLSPYLKGTEKKRNESSFSPLPRRGAFGDKTKQYPFSIGNEKELELSGKNGLFFQQEKNQQNSLPSESKIGESLMLLHPLKFYLQKEAGFTRKLRYYTPSIYRKFSVENNAPYFRVMMKRYFYNYKPSLRWERTVKTASLRKARRKTTRIPRKLQNTNINTNLPASISSSNLVDMRSSSGIREAETNQYLPIQLEKSSLQKSTYNYSVVSKRANRYRYQIYKDVLQHWYYSPFNRILLKLDVDSFIRRQPNAHFLTSKEENLLHLRRFLLSEHYNTLRWYTNMEHYRSMKTQLNGGTKSFSSRSYNQQFSGTFKKIRHLFAITPSITNMTYSLPLTFGPLVSPQGENTKDQPLTSLSVQRQTREGTKDQRESREGRKGERAEKESKEQEFFQPNVLKFDQPLYNEYANSSSNSLLNPLIIHEELLPDLVVPLQSKPDMPFYSFPEGKEVQYGNDLLSQSQNIIREYLIQTRSVREEYIKKLLSENNYAELTKFIYKGQKIRGIQPVTNQKLLNNQEKDYLLTLREKSDFIPSAFLPSTTNGKENFYLTYLKKWKRHVNDQESLKNYLTRRLDKREKRKQKKEKQLVTKLQRLENWFSLNNVSSKGKRSFMRESEKEVSSLPKPLAFNTKDQREGREGREDREGKEYNNFLTSGLQKSILEGMFTLKNMDRKIVSAPIINKSCSSVLCSYPLFPVLSTSRDKQKAENEKNLWKVLLLSNIKEKETISNIAGNGKQSFTKSPVVRLQDLTLRFNDLKFAQNLKLSNNLKTSIQATRKFIQTHPQLQTKTDFVSRSSFRSVSANKKIQLYKSFKNKILTFSNICLRAGKEAQKMQTTYFSLLKEGPFSLGKAIKPIKRKSLKDWRKKERVLGKQKRSRKEFKLLNKKTESISTYVDRDEIELALQLPSRKKRDSSLPFGRPKANEENFLESDVSNRTESVKADKQKSNILNSLLSLRLNATSFLFSPFQKEKGIDSYSLLDPRRGSEQSLVTNTFKRKRSPQRRSRVRRNRGVFKKRTLSDSLRKDFLLFYNETKRSSLYYEKFNENLYAKSILPLESLSAQRERMEGTKDQREGNLNQVKEQNEVPLKQRKSKQRKERYWKQKRSKYAQKRRKYRKRRRYTIVKIRNLNKQFKRVKNQIEIQNWWWKQFIPSIQASNEALWQIEKDKLIQQKLSQLSTSEILERDSLNNSNFNMLQIGNQDFKPLSLPQAIRLNLLNKSNKDLSSETKIFSVQSNPFPSNERQGSQEKQEDEQGVNKMQEAQPLAFGPPKERLDNTKFQVVNKLYESLFIKNRSSSFPFGDRIADKNSNSTQFLVPNTNLPFYAGWDESLRKLIVTNRMLSRKEAGFSLPGSSSLVDPSFTLNGLGKGKNAEFTLAPLQGMNAATTLYWQIPFTTYDPDQFFALGMDGFSPIGWRKFLFRHSILKTWLVNNERAASREENKQPHFSSFVSTGPKEGEQKQPGALVVKTRNNVLNDFSPLSLRAEKPLASLSAPTTIGLWSTKGKTQPKESERREGTKDHKKNSFAVSRRLKKRFRRVKKHPRTPVWFPSGPLLNQVLPVHYIYVFYKRARLPRDRYLKRRLINVKDFNSQFTDRFSFTRSSPLASQREGKEGREGMQSEEERIGERNQNSKQPVVPNLLNYDFTLRKRLKPKRKYHLKRDYYASNVVIPRRLKFMSIYPEEVNIQKWRPLSTLKIHKPISEVVKEQQLLRRSAQQKQRSSKQQQPSMRVKQLRRRVQRQILRSVWRYRPRAGGFVWPGDYLKLELVKAPKLQSSVIDETARSSNKNLEGKKQSLKQKRKKKRTLVEWQIQPKKYLYEKHNIKVLKKKLLQSFRSPKGIRDQRSFGSNTTTLNVLRNSI